MCLSHVPTVRIITRVNPEEGSVLLTVSLSPNTQRVPLFATSKLFPGDKLGQTLAMFKEEVGRIGWWLFRSSPSKEFPSLFQGVLDVQPTKV